MPTPLLDYRRLADLCSDAERALHTADLALARARPEASAGSARLRRDLAQAATALHAAAGGQDAEDVDGTPDRYHASRDAGEGGEA